MCRERQINLSVLRLDVVHPEVPGNKYWKLKYNLEEAKRLGYDKLFTFGGAYSNHIYAVAGAASQVGMKSIGVIRGERIEPLNPILAYAELRGMGLHFVSRGVYREKHLKSFQEELTSRFGSGYIIPEGGSNPLAVKGCVEISQFIPPETEVVAMAVGTGGTMAGVIAGSGGMYKVMGFPVLKGGEFLMENIRILLKSSGFKDHAQWDLVTDYHFGGYAKSTQVLEAFIENFKLDHDCPLDHVYTGKMIYGLFDMIRNGFFPRNKNILAIHTGGLQGNMGFI